MTLAFVGGTHRTVPLPLRERLAFSTDQAAEALCCFRDRFPGREGVLLSTCNRVELYTAGESDVLPLPREQLVGFLAESRGIDAEVLSPVLFGETDEAVVRHLFSVASGLDSMVLGEPQIMSQVKQALAIAQDSQTTGPLTGEMFQAALRTAKRVATETAIGRERLSIPSIAVSDFVAGVFERLDDKKVLLLGAGKMARETLRYLRDAGANDVTIINRTSERASTLASELQARPSTFDRLGEELVAADLIVSTTSATEPIITNDYYHSVEKSRHGRPLVILDLAIPRDIDPDIGKSPDVWLYSIDDLGRTCEANRKSREREIPTASAIIEEESRRFMGELHHRNNGPVIARLQAGWNASGDVELERLFRRLPDLDVSDRAEIRKAFQRYAAKMLHLPLASLRKESHSGPPHGLIEALKRLFDLKD